MSRTWTNWAGNVSALPANRIVVSSTAQIADLVATAAGRGQRVKAVGSGHSFTPIGVTDGLQLDLTPMRRVLHVDPATSRVRVEAGIRLRELNGALAELGLALPNLGDIDAQTLAGAVATSTHGTGGNRFGIAAAVVGVRLVTGSGEIVDIDERHRWFGAARVSLGALGVVTELTLQCVPAFLLHAREEPMELSAVLADLDVLVADNDHFEFYYWPHTDTTSVKRNNRVPESAARRPLGRLRELWEDEIASNGLFELMCRVGTLRPRSVPRLNRIAAGTLGAREYTTDSHRVFVSRRRVRFRESEFALPREAAREAIGAVRSFIEAHPEPIGFPIEVRFTAADDVWLSTSQGRDSVYLAVHRYHRQDPSRYFAGIEEIFCAHGGRPHWGKEHSRDLGYLRRVYPHLDDFRAVRDEVDPQRLFANPYLDRVLGP